MLYTGEKLNPITFKYLPTGFDITDYAAVSACFDDLASRKPANKDDLLELLRVHSDLLKAMADELSWRYVRMTLNADNDAYEQAYNDYFAKAQAANEEKQFQIKQIYYNSPYRKELPEAEFALLDQIMVNEISLYREENIPLMVQESELANKYGGIVSQMSAPFDGEDRTVAQLAVYLKDPERSKREAAWRLRVGLFVDKATELDALYDEMKSLRHQLALNAGFSNYRDYKHQEMGRFSYTRKSSMPS
jgi:oligoendopeptidase F